MVRWFKTGFLILIAALATGCTSTRVYKAYTANPSDRFSYQIIDASESLPDKAEVAFKKHLDQQLSQVGILGCDAFSRNLELHIDRYEVRPIWSRWFLFVAPLIQSPVGASGVNYILRFTTTVVVRDAKTNAILGEILVHTKSANPFASNNGLIKRESRAIARHMMRGFS
jgi:hypothetical protein